MLIGSQCKTQLEVASLTKLFTLYTACSIISCRGIDPSKFQVTYKYAAESRLGTTAWLEHGDKLSLYDLLFGLILPSGNDAAVAISIALGELLLEGEEIRHKENKNPAGSLNARRAFLAAMNQECKTLGLKTSQFRNSHGLVNIFNKTTALDTARVFSQGMKRFPLFKKVVGTA